MRINVPGRAALRNLRLTRNADQPALLRLSAMISQHRFTNEIAEPER